MKLLFTLILILFLFGCDHSDSSKNVEQIQIINDTFVELLGTEWYFESLPIPPIPLSENSTKKDSLKFKREIELHKKLRENRKLDTSRLLVNLYDTLFLIEDKEYRRFLDPAVFERNFNIDTTWIPLLNRLLNFKDKQSINISEITNTGNYDLVTQNQFNDSTINGRKIGIVYYSRIAFNDDKNRGVFYYEFYHGRRWAHGSVIFVEKKDDKWIVIGQRVMWVA
jgi:hypothetical protein